MEDNYKKHLLNKYSSIKDALIRLDRLAKDAILFVVDDEGNDDNQYLCISSNTRCSS